MRLTRNRVWIGGAVLAALVVTTGTWFGLVSPRHDEAADVRAQTTAVAAQNDALEARVALLETQLADLPARRAEAATLREQLPEEAELPTLLRQLSDLAERSGAVLSGVTPTEPAAPAAVAPTAEPTAEATDATTDDATATGTTDASAASLQTVPVAITATGTFAQVQELLRLVQTELPRAVLVRDAAMTAGDTGVELAMTADVFVLPLTAQEEQLAASTAASEAAADEADVPSTAAPTAAPTTTTAPTADDGVPVVAAGTSTEEPM